MQHLSLARHDRVLTVTLNRPELANAFNAVLIQELTEVFGEGLSAERGVHCVVLAAAGRHFSAGADLGWMKAAATASEAENAAESRVLGGLFEAIDAAAKPVIGRIQGAARGGGVGLVAAMDIPVASQRASFALTEVRLGLAPAVISPFVIRKIGQARARELFLTAEVFGADRALEWGLVNHVVAEEALDAAVAERVGLVLKAGPEALAASKRLAREVPGMNAEEARTFTSELIARLRVGAEAQEGMRAFLAKEEPSWVK